MTDTLIHAIDAMIERHLKGDFIGPDEYSDLQTEIIGYYSEHGRDSYLNKYLTEDRFFLYGTCYQRYDNPSDLLAEIEAFLAETGIAETTFGQRAIRDWQLVERLRDGGDVTTRNAAKIREFIASPAARRIVPRGQAAA